jgi:1,2-dihydroxy-3-keto-5-methylthiopentene dioxygenase
MAGPLSRRSGSESEDRVSLLITWPAGNPASVLQQTSHEGEIAAALSQVGCRFERREIRPGLPPDAGQDAVLAAYRDVIDGLIADEGFVTVDVASIHPRADPGWQDSARQMRARFTDEHTHGDDDEVRFMIRGDGVFFLHIGDQVHAVHAEAGDLLGVPQGTTHWFDTGSTPDFTAIRFFHAPEGWVAIPTGSDISRRFPDGDAVRASASGPAGR